MPLPYYVSPEQMMKDKAEYARKGIARGRSIVTLEYDEGILLVAENPSTLLHKISEIYDRIAFAGVGKYNEFENLADRRHPPRRREGLLVQPGRRDGQGAGQRLLPGAGQHLHPGHQALRGRGAGGRGRRRQRRARARSTTSSTTARSRTSGTTRRWAARPTRSAASSRTTTRTPCRSTTALQLGVRALTVTQNKTLDRARPRGRRARPHQGAAQVPPPPRRGAQPTPGRSPVGRATLGAL